MKALVTAMLLLFAAGASDAAETYVCRLEQYGPGNWIPEILFVGRTDGTDQVVISDPIVLHFQRRPVNGRIVADNDQRITFAWSLEVRDRSGTRVSKMIYRATYVRATARMQVSATPAGFAQRFFGRGTCAIRER